MSNGKGNDDTNQELALWILGIAGVLALQRLWTVRAKPWLEEAVPALKNGDRLEVAGLDVGVVDLVVLGVLTLAVVTTVLLIRSSVRARRRRRELESSTTR